MGYDMTIVEPDPDPERSRALENARIRARTVGTELDNLRHALADEHFRDDPIYQAKLEEWRTAYAEECALDTSYFRLNIWGMGHCRHAMGQLGMLNYEDPPAFTQVDYEDYDGDDEAYQEAWNEANGATIAYEPTEGGINHVKLSSNDGWLITPQECLSAVERWTAGGGEIPEECADWWMDWINFLLRAAERGGFQVW